MRLAPPVGILAAALLASSAAARSSPAPGLSDRLAALAAPVVRGRLDSMGEIRVGHLTLAPADGTVVYRLAAGDRECGLLIAGPASMRYGVEDRFAAPVARRNLRRATDLPVAVADDGTLTLTSSLDGAAIWGLGLAAEAPETPAGGVELPGWVRDLLRSKTGTNPERDMLLAQAAGEGEAFRWAALRLGHETLIVDHDARSEVRLEALGRVRRLEFPTLPDAERRLAFQSLAIQPIGRSWQEPTTPIFASAETTLDIVQDGPEHARIAARSKFQALRPGIGYLDLHLLSSTLDARGKVRELRVVELSVDGAPAPFHHDGHRLLVELPRALERNGVAELRVVVEGEVLERASGDRYWRLPIAPWYPVPGGSGVELATVRFTVEAGHPFVPMAPGRVLARDQSNGRNRLSTQLQGPMSLFSVAAGEYHLVTDERPVGRVTVASHFYEKDEPSRRLASNIFALRQCYEDWLGVRYPFPDLAVVEANEWGWAQAPAGMIFFTREALLTGAQTRANSGLGTMAKWTVGGLDHRVAHEVAHAWFPHVVKIRDPGDNWLSESFADYLAAVCLQRTLAGEAKAESSFAKAVREWKYLAADLGDGASIYLAFALAGEEGDDWDRIRLLYGKGPLVLHALRGELAKHAGSAEEGDRLFFGWFQLIVKNCEFKLGSTARAVAILDKLTGKSWQPWFEKYVYGTETPRVD